MAYISINKSRISSFLRNYFRFEQSYFTVGGKKKQLSYFLRMGHLPSHIADRVKFRLFPKLDIVSRFPSHLDIESASACQMRCPMCFTTYMSENLKGVMKWDMYLRLIEQAKELGVYSIKLSWRGEPLLNKRIVDMVRYAKEIGIKEVAFLSNAELLTPKIAEALVDAGLDWLSISADGTDEVYNEIRYPAIFEETVERVRYLKNYRDKKGLKRPLLRVQSIMSATENNPEKYYSTWDGVVDRINVIADEVRDFEDKNLNWDPHYFCAKPWQRLTIAYDGKVHQCISDYAAKNVIGDARVQSLSEIWHGEKAEKVREGFRNHTYLDANPACRFCSYGLITEPDTIQVGVQEMKIRRYGEVAPIVDGGEVQLKTPADKMVGKRRKTLAK